MERNKKGKRSVVTAPMSLVLQVHAHGTWPPLRPLIGISTEPLLTRDGTIITRTGYDHRTAKYVRLDADYPPIPDAPTEEELRNALSRLREPFADFPFKAAADEAMVLAALFSVLCRDMIDGDVPLFAITGNQPALGKTLLGDVICMFATGERMPKTPLPRSSGPSGDPLSGVDDTELEKRIGAHARAGTRVFCLDNVTIIGGQAINVALTGGGSYQTRILGESTNVTVPFKSVVFATGNNVKVLSELRRRTMLIRLESHRDDPGARCDFGHADVIGWVSRHRPQLVMDALMLAREHTLDQMQCGEGLRPLGSYEQWTRFIRGLVVYCGLPDPLEALADAIEEVDPEAEMLGQILGAIERLARPVTAKEMLSLIARDADAHRDLECAIDTLVGTSASPAKLTRALRPYEGRPHRGLMLKSEKVAEGRCFRVLSSARDGS